ncbi:MAG: hypothetical protein FJ009_22440 [Chloroflexi bacterium]|nr:hypothetical protein [Chloroflexota bacterium]
MRQPRTNHFGFRLTPVEREMLIWLADAEGLSEAATLRRLIRQASVAQGWQTRLGAPGQPAVPSADAHRQMSGRVV